MDSNMIDKQCRETVYLTPSYITQPIHDYFGGIALDPATIDSNPVAAEHFYTEKDNGLESDWCHGTFVNPPYGKELKHWCEKIYNESLQGRHIVALLPGQRFETQYWQDWILNDHLTGFCCIRRRVKFLNREKRVIPSNPYGSFLYLYNGSWSRFRKDIGHLGKCLRVETLSGASTKHPRGFNSHA